MRKELIESQMLNLSRTYLTTMYLSSPITVVNYQKERQFCGPIIIESVQWSLQEGLPTR